MSGGEARLEFRVVVTGAFSTGMPLRVRLAKYADFQDVVGRRLEGDGSGGWNREGVRWRGVSSYGEGAGGFSSLVPLVLVQREGEAVRAALRDGGGRPGGPPAEGGGDEDGWGWELRDAELQIYDLGVGVMRGVYDVAAPPGTGAEEAARAVYSWTELDRAAGGATLSPLGASYEALAMESVEAFRDAVREGADGDLPDPWLSPADGGGEPGRLLWLHPVYVLRGGAEASAAELEEVARPFESTYARRVEFPGGLFVPGIQKSAIVVRDDLSLMEEPLGLTTLNWAYYALFMEMDRGLLAGLDDEKWERPASLRELERDAERAYRTFLRFREAKARLESALTGLGPRQTNLWAPIADVTRFGELVAGVESKLEVLQTVAEGRVQEAASRSSRRSRNILTALTALTVVTVVVGLVDHLLGGRSDALGHAELRVLFVLLAFLGAAVVYLLAERDLRWGNRRQPRPRDGE